MKTFFMISMIALMGGNMALAESCAPKEQEGYFCEQVKSSSPLWRQDSLLVLNTTIVDHGIVSCDREVIANFGNNHDKCLIAIRALNN